MSLCSPRLAWGEDARGREDVWGLGGGGWETRWRWWGKGGDWRLRMETGQARSRQGAGPGGCRLREVEGGGVSEQLEAAQVELAQPGALVRHTEDGGVGEQRAALKMQRFERRRAARHGLAHGGVACHAQPAQR